MFMVFLKTFLFGANGPFKTILHNEGGKDRHGNHIKGFSEKNLIQGNLVIFAQK